MTELNFDLLVAAVAFLAGVIGALIGLGGGIIITPLLVLGFHIDIRYAMGAALASVIATSSGAAAAYLRDGISNMRIGMFLCVATTLGAVGGALLATVLDTHVLSVIFGMALLATALLSLRKNPPLTEGKPDPLAQKLRFDAKFESPTGRIAYHPRHVPAGFAVMVLAGILSGPSLALARALSRSWPWTRSCAFLSRSPRQQAIS